MKVKLVIGLSSLCISLLGVTGDLHNGEVLNFPQTYKVLVIAYQNSPVTQTSFSQTEVTKTTVIPYKTVYQESDELELGQSQILQVGRDGWIQRIFRLTLWEGEEVDRVLVDTNEANSADKIVLKGTKIVPRVLNTPGGTLIYYLKQRVYATSYDGSCYGCRGTTYTGKKVKKGVCAVDPSVIPLGTSFYVEGYGLCRAEDIGGTIKGDKVDLGFEDVKQGFWSARWTDIYLLME